MEKHATITPAETKQLFESVVAARHSTEQHIVDRAAAAKARLVDCNMRLVHSVANRKGYANRGDYDDLIQEGGIGLMIAIDKFEPNKGFAFSTYAFYWIQQRMNRYSDRQRTLLKTTDAAELEYNSALRAVDRDFDKMDSSAKEFKRMTTVRALDQHVGDTGDTSTFHELIPDPNIDVETEAEDNLKADHLIDIARQCLDSKRFAALMLISGFGSGTRMSFVEAGERMGYSNERTRRYYYDAIEIIQEQLALRGITDETMLGAPIGHANTE